MFSAAKTASPSGGYNISRSVRLRSSASAYFNRTFTTPTDGKKFTISFWLKRGILGNSGQTILWGNNPWTFALNSVTGTQGSYPSDTLLLWNYGTNTAFASITAAPVLRDPSAWYHIMLVADTAQATASNRILMYINGVNYPTTVSIGQNTALSSAVGHVIGKIEPAATYSDAYLTEYNFIDGQALTPSSFGQSNATTGVWQPKKYTGTYGTNGFYLNFSDNSAATAAAIGKDYSGNGNNWTPNNISVTAGVTYDSMIDVPTPYPDGSTNRGNYCVLNPLTVTNGTFYDGNLRYDGANEYKRANATISTTTGKWYWEVKLTTSPVSTSFAQRYNAWGFGDPTVFNSNSSDPTDCFIYWDTSQYRNYSSTLSTGSSLTSGDVLAFAVDLDANTVSVYKNNTAVISNVALNKTAGAAIVPFCLSYDNAIWSQSYINFGQQPFAYTPPTGYKALNTYNLPSSTITNGGKYMGASLYTGDGTTSKSVTNTGSFKPDFVWVKSRSNAYDNQLFDSVRGTNSLSSNSTAAEQAYGNFVSYNSNGFTVSVTGSVSTNNNTATYVGWQWQAGQGSTSSNASGTITSTVSVSATAGFSVVTYTGTGANATVGHGLGVAPKMVIVKARSGSVTNWSVWHTSLTSGAYWVQLNTTNAQSLDTTLWNSTVPTSSVYSVGTAAETNGSTRTLVAYCWAEIAGFSKFGSYTGNGSTDGPFVYCGFRPRWVMIKRTDTTANWRILDTSRDTYNVESAELYPNLSNAEGTFAALDGLSNGFKIRNSDAAYNASGGTYIYAAFAENPFANALAR